MRKIYYVKKLNCLLFSLYIPCNFPSFFAFQYLGTVNARVDDQLLFDIAEEIETDDHLERLMNALEITQAARHRYHGLNRSEGHHTTRGTRQMLFDWRAKTTITKQRKELKDVLTKAKLLDLRDTFFPGETTSADVETVGTVE